MHEPNLISAAGQLETHIKHIVPRILTQVCRDPNSTTYGSFDRDWWHYRIRDFSSVILQQGSYAIWLAGRLETFAPQQVKLTRIAAAGCRFWNARAVRRGAFEEYYPWEHGYAPAAFSTLAIMKLAAAGVVPPADVEPGARVAVRQLMRCFEHEASNQQVAGLAALAWIGKVFPSLVNQTDFARLAEKTLELQTDEGWFLEYDGPDLAYLSVALDCLWDLYDVTADNRYLQAAARALVFMSRYVHVFGASIGMHNARNTDYILPYGIVRFITSGNEHQSLAADVFTRLYENLSGKDHFAHAIDDRYYCHYTGHSMIRACLQLTQSLKINNETSQAQICDPEPLAGGSREHLLPGCGHFLKNAATPDEYSLVLSLRKGGILTARHADQHISDFGWLVSIGTKQFVSHWWSDQWTWSRTGETFIIRGRLAPHREQISTPGKHLILRALSFCFGDKIIPMLKHLLIFKKKLSPYPFERSVTFEAHRIVVRDRITGLPSGADIRPAPRASKRHVSSADSYHREDLTLCDRATCRRTQNLRVGVFTAETVYEL